jgi:hypothetical protein
VVQEFDATHRLSKLSTAWANLLVGVASFGELLQVDAFFPFFLILSLPLFFCLSYPYFFFFIQGLLSRPA